MEINPIGNKAWVVKPADLIRDISHNSCNLKQFSFEESVTVVDEIKVFG